MQLPVEVMGGSGQVPAYVMVQRRDLQRAKWSRGHVRAGASRLQEVNVYVNEAKHQHQMWAVDVLVQTPAQVRQSLGL